MHNSRPVADSAVPLRTVFPWWLLGGGLLTAVGLMLLDAPGAAGAGFLFWIIVGAGMVDSRRKRAETMLGDSRSVDRRALAKPSWLEPLVALAGIALTGGLGLVIVALVHYRWHPGLWAALAAAVVAAIVLLLTLHIVRSQATPAPPPAGEDDAGQAESRR